MQRLPQLGQTKHYAVHRSSLHKMFLKERMGSGVFLCFLTPFCRSSGSSQHPHLAAPEWGDRRLRVFFIKSARVVGKKPCRHGRRSSSKDVNSIFGPRVLFARHVSGECVPMSQCWNFAGVVSGKNLEIVESHMVDTN